MPRNEVNCTFVSTICMTLWIPYDIIGPEVSTHRHYNSLLSTDLWMVVEQRHPMQMVKNGVDAGTALDDA